MLLDAAVRACVRALVPCARNYIPTRQHNLPVDVPPLPTAGQPGSWDQPSSGRTDGWNAGVVLFVLDYFLKDLDRSSSHGAYLRMTLLYDVGW